MKARKAPGHLATLTRRWWRSVLADYELEEHHVKILTLAAEAWDRCHSAREAIDENGLTYVDRFGAPKTRPEVAIERDSRLAFARNGSRRDRWVAPFSGLSGALPRARSRIRLYGELAPRHGAI